MTEEEAMAKASVMEKNLLNFHEMLEQHGSGASMADDKVASSILETSKSCCRARDLIQASMASQKEEVRLAGKKIEEAVEKCRASLDEKFQHGTSWLEFLKSQWEMAETVHFHLVIPGSCGPGFDLKGLLAEVFLEGLVMCMFLPFF